MDGADGVESLIPRLTVAAWRASGPPSGLVFPGYPTHPNFVAALQLLLEDTTKEDLLGCLPNYQNFILEYNAVILQTD